MDGKVGNENISATFQKKLERNLIDLRLLLDQMLKFNQNSIQHYMEFMQKSFDQVKTYFNATELTKLHQRYENDSLTQVSIFYSFKILKEKKPN